MVHNINKIHINTKWRYRSSISKLIPVSPPDDDANTGRNHKSQTQMLYLSQIKTSLYTNRDMPPAQ